MSNNIKYWKGEEELNRDPQFLADQKREFGEALPLDEALSDEGFELNSNRRDFLKYFGFSVTAVALASCYKTNVRHAVPYLVKPEDVTPGVANYYRSTCGGCSTGCGVEVKVREGRPIKLDGSKDSVLSQGGLCSTGQASILSLYDTERLANPLVKKSETEDWTTLDAEIKGKLAVMKATNKKIVLLSNSINSPSALRAISAFKEAYPNIEHKSYDAVSYNGILDAHANDFGKRAMPHYRFANAKAVVSFGADFLGTWVSPVEFQADYVKNRRPDAEGGMSVHVQFESTLSMTGTNADHRFPMKSSKELTYVATLYNYIAKAKGIAQIPVPNNAELAGNAIEKTAKILLKNMGKSLVVSSSNDVSTQRVINGINMLLDSYGNTMDIVNHSNQFVGSDNDVNETLKGLANGSIAGVIFYGTNPVFNHNKEWSAAIAKAKLSISFASTNDETAAVCQYVCPDNHFLESWSDSEPIKGLYHFTQPTISPVFNTRQAEESLLNWAGALPSVEKDPLSDKGILSQKFEASPYYLYLHAYWEENLGEGGYQKALELGFTDSKAMANTSEPMIASYSGNVAELASEISKAGNDDLELVVYQAVALKDGSQGNNPWLYEMPDPVSKVTWDNYVALPKSLAVKLGVDKDDTVNIEANGVKYENVPAFVQPGQANNTVSMAVGFGHTHAGKVGGSIEKGFAPVGFNAYNFMNSTRNGVVANVKITKGSGSYNLAQTQTHHSIEGRDLVRETTFGAWKENNKAGNEKSAPHVYTIWEKREYRKDGSPNHLWGMAIDLNACTGCGSCIVSCSIENNVPVVGRDEIRLRREMHWMRIDRYYSFVNEKEGKTEEMTRENDIDAADAGDKGEYKHWENVEVIHQPMMCQHCGQAPCETVCPVIATSHSSEGLNMMTYNRCIGTKYCGNNCPYKVRRFNWFRYNDNDAFDFHFNNPLGKMVINPDVTVRTRGVMEKCSFCVQRIQEAKLKVKREGGDMKDVNVETACQRACPSNAIVFGDLHNPDSEISKLYKNERAFSVLDELNVQSSVKYMTKVRNNETI